MTSRPVNLYKRLLVQLSFLADPSAALRLRLQVVERARRYVARGVSLRSPAPVAAARRALAVVEKANVGDRDAVVRVVELAYGLAGRRRRQLLQPLLPGHADTPLIPNKPRTRPPAVSHELAQLWAHDDRLSKKARFVPPAPPGRSASRTSGNGSGNGNGSGSGNGSGNGNGNSSSSSTGGGSGSAKHPDGYAPPLHPRRWANAHWRHVSSLLRRTTPPLLVSDRDCIRQMAEGELDLACRDPPAWRKSAVDDLRKRKADRHTDPHRLTPRFVRRAYAAVWDRIAGDAPA